MQTNINTILFPSSYFDVNRVDEDLQNEYEAALSTGLWNVILFSYNKWFNDGKIVLSEVIDNPIKAVYRGWMMNASQYKNFYTQLLSNGITLATDTCEYEYFHYFPNVYDAIKPDTPQMISVPKTSSYNIEEIKSKLGNFMVKDYVKSVKGTEFPKYFTKDVTEKDFLNAMEIFYKYRGSLFSGGLCFKQYVKLKTYGKNTNEYRVFYVNGEVASISRNSLQKCFTNEPPMDLINKYSKLPSSFYTLDYAELADGSWMILEAGDGSVSGPSDGQDLYAFYRALYQCINL